MLCRRTCNFGLLLVLFITWVADIVLTTQTTWHLQSALTATIQLISSHGKLSRYKDSTICFKFKKNSNITSNTTCIDVDGGIIISLSTCNSSKITQQWTYDFNNKFLRMKEKPNSCLASSPALTKLQLKPCASYDYTQSWGEYMIFGGRDSTNFTYFVCLQARKSQTSQDVEVILWIK